LTERLVGRETVPWPNQNYGGGVKCIVNCNPFAKSLGAELKAHRFPAKPEIDPKRLFQFYLDCLTMYVTTRQEYLTS
jgi:hypothetical protein